jgi:hypothetical protein
MALTLTPAYLSAKTVPDHCTLTGLQLVEQESDQVSMLVNGVGRLPLGRNLFATESVKAVFALVLTHF